MVWPFKLIDLFTDTAAILNFLDLRSIMVCTFGSRSVFRQKENFTVHFSGKSRIIISRNTYRKIGPKSARKYGASISDRANAPWVSYNTS